VIARNVRFRTGEVDLVAEDPQTQMRWVVEVRGRQASPQKASKWLPAAKIKRLRNLAHQMARKTHWSYRILFLQVEIRKVACESFLKLEANIEEFEIPG